MPHPDHPSSRSRSPVLADPTLRVLVAVALFTYTAQNMLNVSIAPLSRALDLPEWIVGAAVSLAALAVALLSQFWGRRSIAWGRRRVLLCALFLALVAGALFSTAVWLRAGGGIGAAWAAGAIMAARGPFFGASVAAIPPTGQALVAEVTHDEASRVRGASAFSGAINMSVMIGSVVSSLLGAWWIFAPVHATPWFVVVALVIAWAGVPHDGAGVDQGTPSPGAPSESGATGCGSPSAGAPSESGATRCGSPSAGARAVPLPSRAPRPARPLPPRVSWTDPRIVPWVLGVIGLYFAAGVTQILMGFLIQDRVGAAPDRAVSLTGLMLLLSAAGAMTAQLLVVPRLQWPPRRLLRAGVSVGVAAVAVLTAVSALVALAVAMLFMGVATGLTSTGFTAGASLAVRDDEQGGVAGLVSATGAITWIFAPVSATALYGWQPLAPFALALALVGASCAAAWVHPGLRKPSAPLLDGGS
ncbi:MFS transporter [Pauljensenia hongkongensis]|uniref:MFS transporter n=1 Tax=Pauljensenia hongkongensis TaxID=178339 RepID=A0A1D8B159_9ACTO|nr:MFS transporter [Pauljensenia hongkongensis]AOS46854.1 MFS transporter [Pauljensenia hongkongensis]EFW10499.1 drug:H+ antiporter-1 family transporter [Actinomyces sp. oral taxon 178 str. F0338]